MQNKFDRNCSAAVLVDELYGQLRAFYSLVRRRNMQILVKLQMILRTILIAFESQIESRELNVRFVIEI